MNVIKAEKSKAWNIVISGVAIVAILLAIVVLFLGEGILQTLDSIYPNWAFPAYFIPWFLLMISSIQKLNKNKHNKEYALQVWILKITIPLFLFTLPFFSQLLNNSYSSTHCLDECQIQATFLLGFEPYCMFLAMLSLFLLFTLPSKWLHNK
ncbi:hypothetical protein ACLKMH_08320 [Psychromonas sp. KJ10-10]|uniref:hypothetical protein n=1 Tax=Psychromonas sp. KJ10-10 TaxID=3391823 RepID=UPI0039B6E76E